MGQRRWDKAWSILAKTMPLPGVLARLCYAPCRDACVRKDAGGSLEMGSLERFCADNAKPVAAPRPLPSRGKSVAVLGGGMVGLCASWELARRGFDVSLHCLTPGGSLLDLAEDVLPTDALGRELSGLEKMGVRIHDGADCSRALLDSVQEQVDAVFIDSDYFSDATSELGTPDELTLGTQRAGVFASHPGESSFILQAAMGRRAANSIERFTQGVSMVTGREAEGPCSTRLFTSLAKVEPVATIISDTGYTEAQARDEARRCIQCECLECVKSCEYLKHYKHYPKVYARQIYNNESIVMGTRQANTMINSCMLCGLCETICPEDFSMADVCLSARQTLVETGHMPQSAHEFALRDMAFANGETSVVVRHAPGTESSDYVFFPGCQLTASDPAGVEAAYADLRTRLGAVGLLLHCCGAPAQWAGRQPLHDESMAVLLTQWEFLGRPRIIVSCPTCLKTLREGLPDADIVTHWSILRTLGLPDGASGGGILAINDPCSARHESMVQEDVRGVLEQLDVSIVEPELTGQYTQCCGFGGLLNEANPALGKVVAAQRASVAEEDFVTYCAMCRDMIAKTGKRAMHFYDLLFPRQADPAARPSPGYSARRENRARLKEQLLRELWQVDGDLAREPHEAIEVAFTDEAAVKMEDRRILKSDVQKVLLKAQESGAGFASTETGHLLASLRPVIVTYWVEYEPSGDGYLVHNVWCHRMRIKGGQA